MFGLSPVIWMVLAGGVTLALFLAWENRRVKAGRGVLIEPPMLRNLQLRNGVMSFLFTYLVQAGIFFTIALFLSIARPLGDRYRSEAALLSLSLLAFAVGIPRLLPEANPRRVIRIGFMVLFAGLVLLVGLLDVGSGPEIVTWPLLLCGAGLGAPRFSARQRHRLGGSRRAERRGGWAAEHRRAARRLGRDGAGGCDS